MKNIENNKLIADFMGWNIQSPTTIPTDLHLSNLDLDNGDIMELKYHTSWDWLMPVVEKIKRELYEVRIECLLDMTTVRVFHNYDDENEISAGYNSEVNNDIKAYYQALVEFIKWNNENK